VRTTNKGVLPFFGAKNFEFLEIYGVSAKGGGGLSHCGQGRSNFVRTFFMESAAKKNILGKRSKKNVLLAQI